MAVDLVASLLSLASLSADSVSDATATFTPTRFLGRTHPILVHFPIALVTVAAVNEAWRFLRRERGVAAATAPLITAAAVMALASTGSGWLNAAWEHDGDTTDHLLRHRWLGTLISFALVGLAVLAHRAARQSRALGGSTSSLVLAQRLGAIGAAALVGLVGHLGGELVHGEGYLQKGLMSRVAAPRVAAAPAEITGTPEERFFLAKVQPIIATHCEECHGATKHKGGLRLVPIGAAFDGPADTWSIIEGQPDESDLIFRVTLPRDDGDAMPPKGNGLTAEEIEILKEWIKNGAVVPKSLRSVPGPLEGGSETGNSAIDARTMPVPPRPTEAAARAIEQCVACGAIAQPIYQGASLFEVNASRAVPAWDDQQLRHVIGACDSIASLNLARSAVSDVGFSALPPMAELARLRLDETTLGDASMEPLRSCSKLRSVNLVGTRVTDAGLERLLDAPALREVYVWGSQVTAHGIANAAERRPEVEVVAGEPAPSAK